MDSPVAPALALVLKYHNTTTRSCAQQMGGVLGYSLGIGSVVPFLLGPVAEVYCCPAVLLSVEASALGYAPQRS